MFLWTALKRLKLIVLLLKHTSFFWGGGVRRTDGNDGLDTSFQGSRSIFG